MSTSLALTFGSNGGASVTRSLSEATPTDIIQKHISISVPEGEEEQRGSLFVGCEDGSLFLLHSRISPNSPREVTPPVTATSPLSPLLSSRTKPRRASSPRSRSPTSPRSTYSPFHVTKPRVVSSVSAAQVEAPKNFVDFDDEQEKMKNMLKRKGVKDKTVVDSLMPGVEKAFTPDKCDAEHTKGTDSAHIASTPLSPASSTHSLSRPSSTSNIPSLVLPSDHEAAWHLACHIIPNERARLSPVRSLKPLERHPFVLSLHESGEVGVYSLLDGSCQVSESSEGGSFPVPAGAKPHSKLPLIWHWRTLHVVTHAESFLVVVCATSEATTSTMHPSDSESNNVEDARLVAFELQIERAGDPDAVILTKIGDWIFGGPVHGIALHGNIDGQIHLLHLDVNKHLIKQRVLLSKRSSGTDSPLPMTGSSTNLPLPNPFKALRGLKSAENLAGIDDDPVTEINLVDTIDLGLLPLDEPVTGIRFDSPHYLASGLAWSEQQLLLFDVSGLAVQILAVISLSGIKDVVRHEHNLVTVCTKDSIELRKLDVLGAQGDESTPPSVIQSSLVQSYSLTDVDLAVILGPGDCIITRTKNGRRRLESIALNSSSHSGPIKHGLWKASAADIEVAQKESTTGVSALLSLELNYLILGYADGFLERTTLTSVVQRKLRGPLGRMSNVPLAGTVTTIATAQLDRTSERRIIAGANDGSIAIYSYESMHMLARWTVFIEPLKQVMQVPSGRLQGCLLCISRDGSIALIALDGCEFIYLVPASVAPLLKVYLGEDNLLLAYSDQRARLWDIKTREFWRSMSTEKVGEMLKQGGWMEWMVGESEKTGAGISSITNASHLSDAGSTLILDTDDVLSSLSVGVLNGTLATGQKESKTDLEAKRLFLRALISPLLTTGLNSDIDRICLEKLGAHKALFGLHRSGVTSIYTCESPREPWSLSPNVSSLRAISIVSLLHALLLYDDKPDSIQTISTFYSVSIGQIVGKAYQAASLVALARIWLRVRSLDLRTASRQLFEVGVTRLPDDQVNNLVEGWHMHLPCSQSEAKRDSTTSALALFICGTVAVDKYSLLPSSVLTDIAKSISLYLHDEHSPHRALGIDLCSRGFAVWQQHVDAVEILRSLFALATSSRKDTGFSIGQQARTAVLQIASGNSPLFMTTVSMDILQPKSVQHRKSVMQLVIFLIHKKPLVLYSNLPRLVEAVVKSLDPNSNANRDAVLDSATEILGHLVETYPSVDFHGPSQRLAIGTSEGAVVMYDLKTATRLYVLEGHTKRTTACAFSPDGRRLVTLSLEEHLVLVWKVGSSFTSFFLPGAPPRQGHGGSDPYKTYDFHIGDEGDMTLAATLELVKFEWPSDRSVKIRIRGATLTFSV